MASTEKKIQAHIDRAPNGSIFYPADFSEYGSNEAVNVALHRLVKLKLIKRIAHGIYAKPYKSNLIGEVDPGAEEIAKAIARRDKAKLLPTGAYAQHLLGLSTQVPLRLVYYTDGAARTINLDQTSIVFKKASPKKIALKGELSKLAVMALSDIGKDQLTKEEKDKVIEVLQKENPDHLKHDIKLAPRWIGEIMAKALK